MNSALSNVAFAFYLRHSGIRAGGVLAIDGAAAITNEGVNALFGVRIIEICRARRPFLVAARHYPKRVRCFAFK